MKKINNKENVKVLFTILNVIVYSMLFMFIFICFYKDIKLSLSRNIIMAFIYLVILVIFGKLFDAFDLGETRVYDLFLSYSLTTFIVNFITYFILCLISLEFVSIWQFIILEIIDVAFAAFVLLKENQFIRDNYPIPKAVAIVGKNNSDILKKIHKYRDILVTVDKTLNLKEININELSILLKGYERVITVDVDYNNKKKILKTCYENHIEVLDIPSITDMLIASSNIMHVIDTPILKINRFGPSMIESFVKRLIDILGSLFLIILTSPIMLVVAIAIKINDGGTILFKQKRLTKDEKVFNIYKFRSMIMDAELFTGVVLAKENDVRITKVGKFIRKTRFDELPQLFNILKGDMTFVGPRPERPEIYQQILKSIPEFKYRLTVKAGLTGYAQIYGKYNTTLKDKLLLDIYYIENYKLIDDVKLLLQTLKVIFKPDSTEGVK